ncbi:MAG: hypothetical protein MUQ10_10755 [Anaerolineae bacterium]|nr:hypothetical protein [Anaerolineae bacterium]
MSPGLFRLRIELIDEEIASISWSSRGLTRIASGSACIATANRTVGQQPDDYEEEGGGPLSD